MTIPQMFRHRHEKWKQNPCMRVKRNGVYETVTWDAYRRDVDRLAAALLRFGVAPGEKVAILSHTRYEWAVADMAALTAGAVVVPLYPNLSAREAGDLLERSGARLLFLSDREQAQKAEIFCPNLPALEKVVCFEASAIADPFPRFEPLAEFVAGAEADEAALAERWTRASGDEVATILFTSGTTGDPKGVQLTHANILSNVEASASLFDLNPADSCLAHLPLAHILERMAGYYLMLWNGCTIAYAESIQTVAQDLRAVSPTLCVSVPRILEKIYASIEARAAEAPAHIKALTFWAIRTAHRVGDLREHGKYVPVPLAFQFFIADRLVYRKIRAAFGGRIRLFVTGGAPLAPELAIFFHTVGIVVLEGYGLTETSPVIAVNTFTHRKPGTVGRPIPGVECRIAEDGEILVRGPNVFPGYYQDEAATRETFSEGGWFHTGDIGEIDVRGFLHITDRKKDLLVTAGGKNVAPQKIENILKTDKYISEAMLYGDRKPFVTALIVPDFEWLERYAGWKGLKVANRAELVHHPRVRDFLARRIDRVQEEAHLASYESVKKYHVLDHEFSQKEGEVTPTLKIRRREITKHYQRELEALYEKE